MAEKTSGTRKSTSSKKASAKKASTITPIGGNVTPIDQNSSQNGKAAEARPEASVRPAGPELLEQIRARAYELFEQRGRGEGFDQQDWAQAEAEVLAKFQREKSA